MKRSGIPVEWYTYENEMARDWLERLNFASEREKTEHLRRVGMVVAEIFDGKMPLETSQIDNVMVELGRAFISGELRVHASHIPADEEDLLEGWRDSLGMSRAAFQRHMTGIGTLVYELLSRRPLNLEDYYITLTQIAERLLFRQAKDPQEMAGEYRKWQQTKREKQIPGRDPRTVLANRRDT